MRLLNQKIRAHQKNLSADTDQILEKNLSSEEQNAWLRLVGTENIGPITFHQLMRRFKTASNVLKRLPRIALEAGRQSALRIPSIQEAAQVQDYCAKNSVHLLACCEPTYPPLLKVLDDAPPFLMAQGRLELLTKKSIAVVGSRNASSLGRQLSFDWAAELGSHDFVVISGMAEGIDSSAHRGGLKTGTIAVMPGGIDHVYPAHNLALYDSLRCEGVLVSEQLPGTAPHAGSFSRRNRLISGLSSWGVLVIEAALKSGSLSTAHYGLQQGKTIFAVPGHPSDPRSAGTSALIRDGAVLVRCVQDILDEQPPKTAQLKEDSLFEADGTFDALQDQDLSDARKKLLSHLTTTPTSLDTLLASMGMPAAFVRAALIELVVAGQAHLDGQGMACLTCAKSS